MLTTEHHWLFPRVWTPGSKGGLELHWPFAWPITSYFCTSCWCQNKSLQHKFQSDTCHTKMKTLSLFNLVERSPLPFYSLCKSLKKWVVVGERHDFAVPAAAGQAGLAWFCAPVILLAQGLLTSRQNLYTPATLPPSFRFRSNWVLTSIWPSARTRDRVIACFLFLDMAV